jgi:hypothetical protein
MERAALMESREVPFYKNWSPAAVYGFQLALSKSPTEHSSVHIAFDGTRERTLTPVPPPMLFSPDAVPSTR